jgi:hypothetical protein
MGEENEYLYQPKESHYQFLHASPLSIPSTRSANPFNHSYEVQCYK